MRFCSKERTIFFNWKQLLCNTYTKNFTSTTSSYYFLVTAISLFNILLSEMTFFLTFVWTYPHSQYRGTKNVTPVMSVVPSSLVWRQCRAIKLVLYFRRFSKLYALYHIHISYTVKNSVSKCQQYYQCIEQYSTAENIIKLPTLIHQCRETKHVF